MLLKKYQNVIVTATANK